MAIKGKNESRLEKGAVKNSNPGQEALFVAEHSPDLLFSYSLDRECFAYVSNSVEQLFGYSCEEVLKLPLEQVLSPTSHRFFTEQLTLRLKLFLKNEQALHVNTDELEVEQKNGASLSCDVTSKCVRAESGELFLVGTARVLEFTESSEDELITMLNKYRDILASIEEGYYEVDLEGKITFFNEAAARICGYTQVEFAALDYTELFQDDQAVYQRFNQVFRSGKPESGFTTALVCKGGNTMHIELSISPVCDAGGRISGFRGLARDVTEKIIFQQQLEYHSMHDQLTGLYNRNYFEEELRRLRKSREYPVSMVSADVNGLKLINDTMGHDHGDRLLQAAASVLKDSLRGSDVLARVGGDEFSAILIRADEHVAEKVMNRVRKNIKVYNDKDPSLYLSLSLGAATAITADTTFNELLKQADDRMYRDKFSPSSRVRGKIVKSLLAALDKRDFIADGHSKRLALLCRRLGQVLKLSPRQMANLTLLAQVHDLGKVSIPDQVLFKKAPLDDREWQIMKEHSEKGYRIALSSNYLSGVAGLILKHHERWDGQGYPLGLKGREIPVECRILSVVDAFDAMTNKRHYNSIKNKDEALEELQKCAGSQFDPEIVENFVAMNRD